MWHIITRMKMPDCAVVCNLINTHNKHITQEGTNKLLYGIRAMFVLYLIFPLMMSASLTAAAALAVTSALDLGSAFMRLDR